MMEMDNQAQFEAYTPLLHTEGSEERLQAIELAKTVSIEKVKQALELLAK